MEIITAKNDQPWWKEAVVYQIYPASFLDSNGTGTGDLKGILSKLDYIKDLGVDCIWISPFYKSPQYDLGYDISDYQAVHEPYGDLADIEAIIAGCKQRGLKILFDLVINHSSHEHKWFKESRKSEDNPYRDYYMWRKGKVVNGKRVPPNNWRAAFGGSVWTYDETTDEYYLHYFAEQQPDFNWESPVVRKALYEESILFWLNKGVDGMRIDVISLYSKHLDFPDAPITEPYADTQPAFQYFADGPRLHEFIKEMYKETFEKFQAVTIGELAADADYRSVLPYVKSSAKEIHMAIQFSIAMIDKEPPVGHYIRDWKLSEFKEFTRNAQMLADPQFEAHCCTYIENHDQARCVSRFGNDKEEYRVISAKMLATYLLTLSGTPIMYQGQEIGQINMPASWSIEEEYHDLASIGWFNDVKVEAAAKKDPSLLEKARAGLQRSSRDHARVPVNWDSGKNGGFSTADSTWMRAHDFNKINVADQLKDEESPLAYYRNLLKFRKAHKDLLVYGVFEILDPSNEKTFLYLKKNGDKVAFVALNFSDEEQSFELPEGFKDAEVAFGNVEGGKGPLKPYEARIYL